MPFFFFVSTISFMSRSSYIVLISKTYHSAGGLSRLCQKNPEKLSKKTLTEILGQRFFSEKRCGHPAMPEIFAKKEEFQE